MTNPFHTWLRHHYPAGSRSINRAAFLANANAVLALLEAEPISRGQINHWLHSGPPAAIAGLPLDKFLALVLECRENPPAKIYLVAFLVSEQENDALLAAAEAAGITVEQYLKGKS